MRSREDAADLMDIAMPLPADLRQCAILLDIDGTILDIAPTPREVSVPPTLRQTLARLQELTGGALALVSGRPLADIDLIFAPLKLAAVGGHGAELRLTPGAEPARLAVSLREELRRRLAALTELGTGILAEDKGYSFALHYRLAPDLGPALLRRRSPPFARTCRRHGRCAARQGRGRGQAGAGQQGAGSGGTDEACAISRPAPGFHRRRHHRRAGIRHHRAIRRLGLFGRPDDRGRRWFTSGRPDQVRSWLDADRSRSRRRAVWR